MRVLSAFLTIAFLSTPSLALAAGDAHGAAEASKGGLPQFDPTWFASQVFWLAVSFATLYFIFAKKTLPDISGVIENRKNHIQSDLETAEKLTAEADSVHDAYQQNLTKAQDDAAQAIHKMENDMKAKSAQAADDFRARSETELQGGRRTYSCFQDGDDG